MVIDLPRPRKHLNYSSLNLKSIRILNRLVAYLERNKTTLDQFLEGLQIQQTVKTKTKSEKVDIVRADKFFQKLGMLEIRKSSLIYMNLS